MGLFGYLERANNFIKMLWGGFLFILLRHEYGNIRNSWVFVCNYHIGDNYVFFSLMDSFKKKHNAKNVTILTDPVSADIARLFPSIDIIRVSKQLPDGIANQFITRFIRFRRDSIFVLDFPLSVEQMSQSRIHFADGIKIGLRLPLTAERSKPDLNRISSIDMTPFGELLGTGKTILISPHSYSISMIQNDFWHKLVEAAKEKGFNILCNVTGKEKSLPGTVAISPTILQAMALTSAVGIFIGMRSGLCDVLSSVSATKVILYPDTNSRDIWSLGNVDHTHELVLNNTEPILVVEKIFHIID